MTALERLTAFLCSTPDTEKLDAYHAVVARQILDQHAHELAEEIRNHADGHYPYRADEKARNEAADLIDPQGA